MEQVATIEAVEVISNREDSKKKTDKFESNVFRQKPSTRASHLKLNGEESLSTCSTNSNHSMDVSKSTNLVVNGLLTNMIDRIITDQAPEELVYDQNARFSLSRLYNPRNNRVLTKIMANFENFVNDSYLGASRSVKTGYSGMDAFVAKDMIEGCIRQLYPYAQVEAYGSMSTGLWLPGQSDIDLLICFNKFKLTEGSMLKYFPPISPPPFQMFTSYQEYSHRHSASISKTSSTHGGRFEREHPQVVNPIVQSAYVHSWTQVMNKLYAQNKDIDERGFTRTELLAILETTEDSFRKTTWFTEIKLIKSAMPVVKLKVCCGNNGVFRIPVDVSVLTSDHAGLQARDYICQVINKCPGVFRPLVLVIKQLLRENSMHDVYTGGLGSYSLCLMVVFFLTRCGFDLSSLHQKSEYSSDQSRKAVAFHLPPNPLPNQFSSSKHEILIDDKGVPPLLDSNLKEKYKEYPSTLQNLLEESSATIMEVTSGIRSHLLNTESVRRSPELLGCLLVGFLRLFSPKENGGLDLSYIGFRLENKGKLFMKEAQPHPGILIECPVTKNHTVGLGSYNMLKIQALFSTLVQSLAVEPQKLLFFLKYSKLRLSPSALTVVQPHPHSETKPHEEALKQVVSKRVEADRKPLKQKPRSSIKKKLELNIEDMDRKLAAVQETRYKRRLKASNLARFQSETFERKKTLAERFASSSPFRREKDRNRKPVAFKPIVDKRALKSTRSPDIYQQVEKRVLPVQSQVKIPKIQLESANNKAKKFTPKSVEKPPEMDYWDHQKSTKDALPLSVTTKSGAISLETADDVQLTSWATVVKSPSSTQMTSPRARAVKNSNFSFPTVDTEIEDESQITEPASHRTSLNMENYVVGQSTAFKEDVDSYSARKSHTPHKKNSLGHPSRRLKNREDKLQQKVSSVLFIGNLSYSAQPSDIETLKVDFAKFGKIISTVYDKNQGMLWIRFSDSKSSMSALKSMDQRKFLHRPLYVDFSQMPAED